MDKFCSFCAKKPPNLHILADKTHWLTANTKNPLEMLQIFKDSNDLHPSKICENCLHLLKSAYNFHEDLKKSLNILKQLEEQVVDARNKPILPKFGNETTSITTDPPKSKPARIYSCLDCPTVFKSHRNLREHEKTHENSQICKFCNTAVHIEELMKNHLEEKHADSKFKCVKCENKSFSNKFLLLGHFKSAHKSCQMLYFCSECPFAEFQGVDQLLEHRQDAHTNDDDLCMHEEFLDDFFLNQDENSFQFGEYWDDLSLVGFDDDVKVKATDDCAYKCPICLKEFAKQCDLRLHLAEGHGELVLMCNACGKKFRRLEELKQHRQVHRDAKEETRFTCELCDKQFKTSQGYQYHSARHRNDQSLACVYCGKAFLAIVNLRAHIKNVHSVVKKHTCSLCDRKFATLDHLKKHVMSLHQKERNFLCSKCGKGFAQASHLKQHAEIHFKAAKEGEKVAWDHSYT